MTQSDSILIQKFITEDIQESKLREIYKVISTILEDSGEDFNLTIKALKLTLDYSYDFEFLSEESDKLGSNRKEIRSLLEVFSEMLGAKLESLVENKLILTSPSNFEDYCPYPNNELIVYSNSKLNYDYEFLYDGNKYKIVDSKLESTPYYSIWCSEVERV